MIECKICGHQVKYRLIEHIQKTHKLDIDFYKENFGDVISKEYKEKVSEKSKEKWQEEEYREKTKKSREWIYNDIELQQKRTKSILKYYSDGGKVWNDGLTKNDDVRLKSIGEKNKEHLTGRTKENYEYLKIHSDLMKDRWEDSNILKEWKSIQNNEYKKDIWKRKISETISTKILNGELNTLSSFKSGWYINSNNKYWYCSKLEEESMILFDKYKLDWTNKHGIRIEYFLNEKRHYYIPDFLIKIKNIHYIIEMKGCDWDGDTKIKKEYAEKKLKNYNIFYNLNDLENFINKIIN